MTERIQGIAVYQTEDIARRKIDWISQQGKNISIVQVESVPGNQPAIIDEPEEELPALQDDVDLVLSYLRHPDLVEGLSTICEARGIPLVASGRKLPNNSPLIHTPRTCCALARDESLGAYADQFGAPELKLQLDVQGLVKEITVIRGSPCGSTWEAADKVLGMKLEEAVTRFGLETQFLCQADPAGWDPLWGKSPVHFAARVHAQALKKSDPTLCDT